MLQSVQRRELERSLPQKLRGGGLRFEVEVVIGKCCVEAFTDEILERVGGDLQTTLQGSTSENMQHSGLAQGM